MTTPHRLLPLLMLIVAGCDPPPVKTPEVAQAAPGAPQTTDQTLDPTSPPEATPDASEITGKVVHVIDGDTIDMLTADITTIRIRLNGIDAPETGQPFGKNAQQFLSEFIALQVVRVVTHGEDRLNVATPISLPLACKGDEQILKSQ